MTAPSIDAVSGLAEELRARLARATDFERRYEQPPLAFDEAEALLDALEAQARELARRDARIANLQDCLANRDQVLDAVTARADAAEARIAALEDAVRAILSEETVSVHVGYDDGPGGGNYVYADAVRTDSDAFRRARTALSNGEPKCP